mmetsp:Transcript_5432/g.13008  ORF Transcript_5432/g.13008 Transcript_5432/m.13008 type:complete len:404 (-) Transcript_5432:74-1285(-)
MPLSVPPELKRIKPFVQRAEELDRDKSPESRIVAYYCRQWAVQTGIPLSTSSDAAKTCLGELLGQLEGEKGAMSVFNRAESKQICRGFADTVFDRANAVDRAGAADKATARTFYAAASFFEILQQFDDESTDPDVTKEEEERRVYAKWKATEILKAIREGRTPAPGAFGEDMEKGKADVEEEGDEDEEEEEEEQEDVAPAAEEEVAPDEEEEEEAPDVFIPPLAPTTGFAPLAPSAPEPEPEPETEEEEGTEVGLDGPPPPAYPGNDEDDDDATENDGDVFVPGAVKSAAAGINRPPMAFDDAPRPPPVVPPVVPKPLPPPAPAPAPAAAAPPAAAPKSKSSWAGFGVGKKKTSSSQGSGSKVSKAALADAKELTKFALAALDARDADMAAERLQQALSALGR